MEVKNIIKLLESMKSNIALKWAKSKGMDDEEESRMSG